jgi:hypothetical protein
MKFFRVFFVSICAVSVSAVEPEGVSELTRLWIL